MWSRFHLISVGCTCTYHGPSSRAATQVNDSGTLLGDGDMDVLVAHDHLEDIVLQM